MKLPFKFSYQVKPLKPYCFRLTVRKPAGWSLFTPFEVYENETLWSALHLNDELVGVKVRSPGNTDHPLLKVDVFTKKYAAVAFRENVREGLNELLGVNEDLAPFYTVARNDPILKHVIADLYGMHDTFSSSLFARATLAILLQMTGIKRGNQMMNFVITKYGRISTLTAKELAKNCKVGYRAKRLVKLAKVMSRNSGPTFTELKALTGE